jgi:hypothetical protein
MRLRVAYSRNRSRFARLARMKPDISNIPADQARLQLSRILESEVFHDSPTLQRLLTYLVDEALAGRMEGLKEYSIGTSVFQRGENFDPRTDSIVRVQMGILRKKLGAYYSGAGARDEIVVEVPRGHYAPAITRRPARPPESEPLRKFSNWTIWMWTSLVLGSVVLAGAVAGLRYAWNGRSAARPVEARKFQWSSHPVWKGFFEPGSSAKLVVGVPYMFSVGGMMVRDPAINHPGEMIASPRVRSLATQVGSPTKCEVYTGLGEAAGINLLTRFFAGASQDLPLIRSRLAKWQDLATGNAIFLSSARFQTLDQEIPRPADFEFFDKKVSMAILNRRPKPGEQAEYLPKVARSPEGADDGTDYALISVWPGTMRGRRIISMGGTYTWGTEGAAEYLTDGPSLEELKGKLAVDGPAGDPDAGLQIVLKVRINNDQVASTTYVTHHWLK